MFLSRVLSGCLGLGESTFFELELFDLCEARRADPFVFGELLQWRLEAAEVEAVVAAVAQYQLLFLMHLAANLAFFALKILNRFINTSSKSSHSGCFFLAFLLRLRLCRRTLTYFGRPSLCS